MLIKLEAALDSTQVQLERFTIQCVEASAACRVWLIPPMEAFQEPGLSEQVVPALLNHMPDLTRRDRFVPHPQRAGWSIIVFSE